MITNLAETSFKDVNGIYRKFGLQFLSNMIDQCMIFANFDGYDYDTVGWNMVDFSKQGNIDSFKEHLNIMYGIKDISEYRFLIRFKDMYFEFKFTVGGNYAIKSDSNLHLDYEKFLV